MNEKRHVFEITHTSQYVINPQDDYLPYVLAVEAAQLGMWDWHLDEEVLIWSDQCKRLFGLPIKETITTERFFSLIHPLDREQAVTLIQDIVAQKHDKFAMEYRALLPDNTIRWIEARGRSILNPQNNTLRLLGIVMDITERKQAEESKQAAQQQIKSTVQQLFETEIEIRKQTETVTQLATSLETEQAQLQVILDQAPAGIIIVEAPSGKIISYNEEAEKLLGHPLITSDNYTEYVQYYGIHEDGTPYKAEEYPTAQALLSGEIIRDTHVTYLFSDGFVRHLSVNAAPIRNTHGQIVSVVCTFYDISELYEINRRKDEFFSIASHELKTPLTSIKGNLQLTKRRLESIRKTEDTTKKQDALNHAQELISRALRQVDIQKRLIDDLVDASRLQAAKLRIVQRPCDLVELLKTIVADQCTANPQRAIELHMPPSASIPIFIDPERISQVINNYISNAIKYTPTSCPIQVGLITTGDSVQVWIQDEGPGLSVEDQQKIWERFYQVKGRLVQQGVAGINMGLGLYICKELIHLHHGTVGVDSQPGVGARFWFKLPITTAQP